MKKKQSGWTLCQQIKERFWANSYSEPMEFAVWPESTR